jgi:transcription elongation GreA/GreB family factor
LPGNSRKNRETRAAKAAGKRVIRRAAFAEILSIAASYTVLTRQESAQQVDLGSTVTVAANRGIG